MDIPVGHGFRPFDEEVIHHLRNKIEGKNELVDGEISEANICSCDPWDLRRLYKYKTRDLVWYFFSRRDNKYGTGNRQSRTTPSGKWKLTGESVDVKEDQRRVYFGVGDPQRKIGHKRVLVFRDGRNSEKTKSDWVIHEFHYDLLPEHQRTYVICRLEYKGSDKRYLFDNPTDPIPTLAPNASEGSVVNQSRQGNSGSYSTYPEYNSPNEGQWSNENFNMQQLIQGDSGFFNGLSPYDPASYGQQVGENFNMQPLVEGYPQSDLTNYGLRPTENFILQHPFPHSALYDNDTDMIPNGFSELNGYSEERTSLQQNYSIYRPPQPVSGVFSDDSDSDSDSTIFGATSSSTDSIGRSNEPHHTSIHDIPSPNTVDPLSTHDAPEQPNQLNLQLQSREQVINTQQSECEWKMAEDSIKRTPSTNTVKQRWIVLEKKNQRNAKWNYLKKMIIGILLFIYIIGWMILVH